MSNMERVITKEDLPTYLISFGNGTEYATNFPMARDLMKVDQS